MRKAAPEQDEGRQRADCQDIVGIHRVLMQKGVLNTPVVDIRHAGHERIREPEALDEVVFLEGVGDGVGPVEAIVVKQ